MFWCIITLPICLNTLTNIFNLDKQSVSKTDQIIRYSQPTMWLIGTNFYFINICLNGKAFQINNPEEQELNVSNWIRIIFFIILLIHLPISILLLPIILIIEILLFPCSVLLGIVVYTYYSNKN